MELINDKDELMENAAKFDSYLVAKKDPEMRFAIEVMRKEGCFVVVHTENEYKFYPGRFVGCKNNTMDKYLADELKQGKQVNPTLSKIIGSEPAENAELDKAYKVYCQKLGFIARNRGAFGVERKYWSL